MDKIISTALSETDRLKELLYQSIKAPGLNPANTFLLLNSLLEREFSGEDTSEAFVSFVRSPRPEGLGMEPDDLLKIVMDLKHPHERVDDKLRIQMDEMRDRVRTLTLRNEPSLFDPAEAYAKGGAKGGRGRKAIGTTNSYDGLDATYALRRLKRDRPDLAEKVITGELSANAAAIEAGFRKPPSPLKQLRKAWDKASADERAEFFDEIEKEMVRRGPRRMIPDWYPFFVVDYRRDTYDLSLEEDAAYRRLIDEYMITRQPLPSDNTALARIVGIPKAEWTRLAPKVRRYFKTKNDKLWHKRCEMELRAQNARHNRQIEKSRKGGIAKALKDKRLAASGVPNPATLHYKRKNLS